MRPTKEQVDTAIAYARTGTTVSRLVDAAVILSLEVEALRAAEPAPEGEETRLAIADERAKVVFYLKALGLVEYADQIESGMHAERWPSRSTGFTAAPSVACDRLTGETARAS